MIRFIIPVLLSSAPAAQVPVDIARERADYATWLANAPNSPLAAIVQQPIGPGITLGRAASDVPLQGVSLHRVTEAGGSLMLEGDGARQPFPRHRALPLGGYILYASGPPGRSVLTVFSKHAKKTEPPAYYPYDSALVFTGPLHPPAEPGSVRVLAVDGIEVETSEAGTVILPLNGNRARLGVRRFPVAGTDESELEIYFRDATNGAGTYPAGRFVALIPLGDGRYRVDFNRARNPFCAYSSVYACPAPWRGNTVPAPVSAGERYEGGGLAAPALHLEGR